jgi:hypothetical protein
LDGEETNQSHFSEFLFHLPEVVVSVDFAREKNLFLTSFAQRKLVLWKSCGFALSLFLYVIAAVDFGQASEEILASLLSAVTLSVCS